MSNLILPNQQPKPQPGIQFSVSPEGSQVVVQILSTMVLGPDQATDIAGLITKAAEQARSFVLSVENNGTRLVCPDP